MARWQSFAALVLLVVVAIAATACGSEPPREPPAPRGKLEYVRTGGLANVGERLTIRADGSAMLTTSPGQAAAFVVRRSRLDAVERALDDAGFAELATDERTIPEPDGFNYAIRYRGHLVRREQAGLDPDLARAIRRLDTIVASER